MNTALIVETRPLPNLKEIIDRHFKYLSKEWHLHFCGSIYNQKTVKELFPDCIFQCLYFPESIGSEYNSLLTKIGFWQSIPDENILIFQHDSGILRTGIEDFFEYDFIGAPLYHIPFPHMNGGFSLRHKSAMIKCIEDSPYRGGMNEDMYFCEQLVKLGGKLPTKEVAQSFSVETIFGLKSIGYHAINKWHTPEKCNQIINQYK